MAQPNSQALHDLTNHVMILVSELQDIDSISNGELVRSLSICVSQALAASTLIPVVRKQMADLQETVARCSCSK